MAKGMILVIDDDGHIRAALSQVLEDEGYDVVAVANGRSAVEVVRHGFRPDVILLDVLMPEMDGWHFLSARLRHPALITVPIILISALPKAEVDAQRVGAAAFVAKPFHVEDLLATIVRCREECRLTPVDGVEVSPRPRR